MSAKSLPGSQNINVRRDHEGQGYVRVTLQYTAQLPPKPRADRKAILNDIFANLTQRFAQLGVRIQPDSVSVSGQFVIGFAPAANIDAITANLAKQQVRVDVLSEEKLF